MKNLLVLLIVFVLIGTASATFLTDNGDFEATAPGEGWEVWAGGGAAAIENLSGGVGDSQYVSINCSATAYAGWYNQDGGGGELNVLGIPAGTTVTVQCDMKSISGAANVGGLKAESWVGGVGGASVGDSGNDGWPITATTSWETYSIDYTLTTDATELVVSMMNLANTAPVNAAGHVGFDNIQILIPGGTPALRPIPYVGALLPDDTTALTWENPDPNDSADTVTAVAYLLESDTPLTDPNLGPDVFDPGVQTLIVTGNSADVTEKLTVDKYYYWAVHVTDPNSGGPITIPGFTWNFIASGDSVPTVDAGADQYLVTTGSPMTINLDATVSDDELAGPVTITWTNETAEGDANPNTVITYDPNEFVEDPTVTLTNAVDGEVTGYYQFQISVDDGVNAPVIDQVIIGVYGTCAEAADADPDDDYDITGDLNLDCKKNLADFAIFAAGWLDCDTNRPLDVTCP